MTLAYMIKDSHDASQACVLPEKMVKDVLGLLRDVINDKVGFFFYSYFLSF